MPKRINVVSSRTHKEIAEIEIKGSDETSVVKKALVVKNGGAGGVSSVVANLRASNNKREVRALGFSGKTFENTAEGNENFREAERQLAAHDISIIPFTQEEYTNHYLDFCNLVLWFLLHSESPALETIYNNKMGYRAEEIDATLRARYRPRAEVFEHFSTYESKNKEYADKVIQQLLQRANAGLDPSETQFVQDYQLMMVPGLLREGIQTQAQLKDVLIPIGFFLHIPFPGPASFETALQNGFHVEHLKKILWGMLGADQIGFHIKLYRDNFLATIDHFNKKGFFPEQLIIDIAAGTIAYRNNSRKTKVMVAPIGIDYATYAAPEEDFKTTLENKLNGPHKETAENYLKQIKAFEDFHEGTTVILSIERADPIKGILEKLLAFDRLLINNQGLKDTISYHCVAVESRKGVRANDELMAAIEKAVVDINKRHASARFPNGPIMYSNKGVDTPMVGELYRRSHIMNAASYADGMNLSAMEYIAGRHVGSGGILFLNNRMGVTDRLTECGVIEHCQVFDFEQPGIIVAGSITEHGLDCYAKSLSQAVERVQNPAKAAQTEQGMQALKQTIQKKCSVREWVDNSIHSLEIVAKENYHTVPHDHSASSETSSTGNTPIVQAKTQTTLVAWLTATATNARSSTPSQAVRPNNNNNNNNQMFETPVRGGGVAYPQFINSTAPAAQQFASIAVSPRYEEDFDSPEKKDPSKKSSIPTLNNNDDSRDATMANSAAHTDKKQRVIKSPSPTKTYN